MEDPPQEGERSYAGLNQIAELIQNAAATAPIDGDLRPFCVGWGFLAACNAK